MKRRLMVVLPLLLVAVLIGTLAVKKFVVFDHSAQINTEWGFVWKGVQYIPITVEAGKTTKCIAKTTDGQKIKEYEDDPSHTFLELRSFLDNNSVVREDYIIPTEGTISCVYISNTRVTDSALYPKIKEILECDFESSFFIKSKMIYSLARRITVGYNDCPVGTQFEGMIGNINGKWVFIYPEDVGFVDKTYPEKKFECHIIPERFESVFDNIAKSIGYDIFVYEQAEEVEECIHPRASSDCSYGDFLPYDVII